MSASSRSLRPCRKSYAGPYRKSVFSFAFIARSLLRNTATTCTCSFRAVHTAIFLRLHPASCSATDILHVCAKAFFAVDRKSLSHQPRSSTQNALAAFPQPARTYTMSVALCVYISQGLRERACRGRCLRGAFVHALVLVFFLISTR